MSRMLRIDLRRSSAVGAGLLLLVLGVAAMYLPGTSWTGQWTAAVIQQREYLALLWPLGLASGAWLVGRDRRGKVGELFATTPRPAWQRYAPPALALALTVGCAYLLMSAALLPLLAGRNGHLNPLIAGIVGVGTVSLVAAGLLGMAAGRLLPSPLTAPALAVAGLLFTLLPVTGRLDGRAAAAAEALPPGIVSPFSEFAIVPAHVSAAQLIWFGGLGVTGYLLLVARDRVRRVAAVLPAVLGAAVAVPMLPADPDLSAVLVADRGALEQVCTPDAPTVCVTREHLPLLAEIVGPARSALARLSVLPDAPTTVRESTGRYTEPADRPDPAVARYYVSLDTDGSLFQADLLERELLDGGGTSACRTGGELPDPERHFAARRAVAHWLAGSLPQDAEPYEAEGYGVLAALPRDEALRRVAAVRAAALRCEPDLWPVLTAGGAR
ncbi:hypothetical protein [Spirilliplanes yamanashiensis]|uniref:Uncharacterized protein n=1 Tax=Spirilliplanes yamanashiensis TaxID=42233 RepID=A0A8J3Y4F7_9ACTN|nr:hypothetical protein [Spirilliplanes yamanashiensis]MDP9819619.1 hypothetical protein [Spirilliplanes yamanashiensis]GIJ01561.1 hypothetical protein Sya03_09130 [Spirilliplanes yamanashiensis]